MRWRRVSICCLCRVQKNNHLRLPRRTESRRSNKFHAPYPGCRVLPSSLLSALGAALCLAAHPTPVPRVRVFPCAPHRCHHERRAGVTNMRRCCAYWGGKRERSAFAVLSYLGVLRSAGFRPACCAQSPRPEGCVCADLTSLECALARKGGGG